jgi:hypothetical protein
MGNFGIMAGTAVGVVAVDMTLKQVSRSLAPHTPYQRIWGHGTISFDRGDDTDGGPGGRSLHIPRNPVANTIAMGVGVAGGVGIAALTKSRLGAVAGGLMAAAAISNMGESLLRHGDVSNWIGIHHKDGSGIETNLADLAGVAAAGLAVTALVRMH